MAKKVESKVPETIDSVEALQTKIAAMREAQKNLPPLLRSRLIKSFLRLQWLQTNNVSRFPNWPWKKLGMGVVEDKVIKNHYAAEYMYNAYKRVKPAV